MAERSGSVLRCCAAVLLACVLVFALAGCGRLPVGAPPAKTAPPNAVEQKIINAINTLRASHHLSALNWHSNLEDKARLWSAWMAGGGCGGTQPSICHSDLRSGITAPWSMLEENVGAVTPKTDVAGIINGFAKSPEHLANMLNNRISFVGIGVAYGGNTLFVTEEFLAT